MLSRRIANVLVAAVAGAAVLAAGCAGFGTFGGRPAEPTQAISDLALPSAKTSRFLTQKHFVTQWLVLGPFAFAEADFGGDQQQAATDNAFMPREASLDGTQTPPEGATWRARNFQGDFQAGRVDLDALYKTPEHAAAYAVAWLHCPEAVSDAKLLMGSDDYLKVWINGKLVHTYKEKRRASEWDQDTIDGIKLRKGYNHVVVKCVDVVFDWEFYFRLTDKDGRPITVTARTAPPKTK